MKIALCNEVLRDLEFPAQCERAAALGYSGLELAPFTLGEAPHRLSADKRAQLRRVAADSGIAITGLHWLLLTPPGLSITAADPGVREATIDVLTRLIDLCSDLGGKILVHGSPKQRQVKEDEDPLEAWRRARDLWATIARQGRSSRCPVLHRAIGAPRHQLHQYHRGRCRHDGGRRQPLPAHHDRHPGRVAFGISFPAAVGGSMASLGRHRPRAPE